MNEKNYVVVWVTEIEDAASPEEAARRALESLQVPTEATRFTLGVSENVDEDLFEQLGHLGLDTEIELGLIGNGAREDAVVAELFELLNKSVVDARYRETMLDEDVHRAASRSGSDTNNEGLLEQLHFLFRQWGEEGVRKAVTEAIEESKRSGYLRE